MRTRARVALGQPDRARLRWEELLGRQERLAEAEPGRTDYQQNLAVLHSKMGDFYRMLGEREQASQFYLQSLAIRERLAQAEPGRADYQWDLSISYNKVGDLYRDLGDGDRARQSFLQSLAIAERLAQAEPDRADYQRDLMVSLWRVGTIEESPAHFQRALAVLEALQQTGRMLPGDEPFLRKLREMARGQGAAGS